MNEPVRTVIADDHPMFLYGLKAALAGTSELRVVGEALDGDSLARVVARERPAVVLTDLEMPGVDGTGAMARMCSSFPDLAVLVLTMHADDAAVLGAIRAGARGYLLKGADRDDIVRAVFGGCGRRHGVWRCRGQAGHGPAAARRPGRCNATGV